MEALLLTFLLSALDTSPPPALPDLPCSNVHWFENRGQYPPEVRFGMWTRSGWVGVTDESILLHAMTGDGEPGEQLELRFEGANLIVPQGLQREPGLHHSYMGRDPERWVTGVRSFARVRLEGLYDGIDLELGERNGSLKYDLHLAPGADLSQVVVRASTPGLRIAQGGLFLGEAGAPFQPAPESWQVTPAGRRGVDVQYRVVDSHRFGFEAPARDPDLPLVIDPELLWSTYWGGNWTSVSLSDQAFDVELDAAGNLYVAGTVEGVGSLMTPGTYQSFLGMDDVFVAKFEHATGRVIYSARIGSSSRDEGRGVAVDLLGRATVVGYAAQGADDFPTTPGAFDPETDDFRDAGVVFRLSADGSVLEYSTFLESSLGAHVNTVDVTPSGSAIVAGESFAADFPTTPGSFNTLGFFTTDGFVTRLDPTGSFLEWSGILGGINKDVPLDLQVTESEEVVVVGYTGSPGFPTTPGVVGLQFAGQWDGFVTKIAADGSSLVWSTFLGGSDIEQIYDVELLSGGDLILTGYTESTDYPTSQGAFQETKNLDGEGFLTRIRGDGSAVVWSTYLGDQFEEAGFGTFADASGVPTVVGWTESLQFPITPGAFDEDLDSDDAFVARFRPDGSGLLYSTFLGGLSFDNANAVVANPAGLTTVVGRTAPLGFPTTPNAVFPGTLGGQFDSFITTFELLLEGVHTAGGSSPSCLGPVNANATTMPLAGQPFGLYCTQAPPDADGYLITFTGESMPSIKPVKSGPEGYLETDVGVLPNTPGKLRRYRYTFRNTLACPGQGAFSFSNLVLVQVQ